MPTLAHLFWLFFSFEGRLGRVPYCLGFLFQICLLGFPFYRFLIADVDDPVAPTWSLLVLLIFFPTVFSLLCLTAKRLHDCGRVGFEAIVILIPIVSFVVFVALCLVPGEAGPNDYGRRANDFG